MFYRVLRCPALFTLLCLLVLPGCKSTAPDRGTRRLALVRFENLSSDPGLDWLSRAIPGTLAAQLAGSPEYSVFTAENGREAGASRANLELLGYYTVVNGRLQITADLRVPAEGATARTIQVAGDPATQPLKLIDSIARQLGSQIKPFSTSSVEASRAYWSSSDASSPQEAAGRIEMAIRADPAFAASYLTGIEAAVRRGDGAEAGRLLGLANSASASFDDVSRARLRLLEANLKGDASGRVQALTELTRLLPSDAGLWRELGDAELQRRNYAGALAALGRALKIIPDDIASLNLTGYAKAFAGDFTGARTALEEYSRRAPEDANAADSLGDVSFYFGHFAEAAKYYQQANQINAALLGGGDLYRAALSRYFAGDLRDADSIFASFLQFRAANGDAIGPVREAVWEASTGRLDRASLRLENFLRRQDAAPEVRSIAASQLAIFALSAGKPARFEALPSASPAGRTLQFYAGFLSQPDVPVQGWETRAAPLMKSPQPLIGKQLLGYALLLHGHFAEAVPVWQDVLAQFRPDADSDARAMLAWANAGAGRTGEARKLLEHSPIPPRMAEPGLTFLSVAKYQELRTR